MLLIVISLLIFRRFHLFYLIFEKLLKLEKLGLIIKIYNVKLKCIKIKLQFISV